MPVSSSTVHFETGITQERQCGKSCSEVLLAHEIAEDFEDQLDPDEFVDTEEIGYGNGGLVFKSVHIPTRTVVAKKVPLNEPSYFIYHFSVYRYLLAEYRPKVEGKCCKENCRHFSVAALPTSFTTMGLLCRSAMFP